jgi:AcrR family transcriptional regulator
MTRNKQQNEQIRIESQKKILIASRKLFAERGFDNCSISDIARQVEMSQGNIYWYFHSKEELFKAVLLEGFEALSKLMINVATETGSSLEKIELFLENFMAFMKDQGGNEFLSVVINFMALRGTSRFSDVNLSTEQIGAGYHQNLNAVFLQGQTEGYFQKGIDPNLLSTFLFSFINGLMLMYPNEWKDIPNNDLKKAVFRLLGTVER